MLERLELPREALERVIARCAERGIGFLSTPFDEASADLLAQLRVPAFKIGSGELTNLFLLERAASKGRPVLLSTGMATLDEVVEAAQQVRAAGAPGLVILHCVSNYPADPADANLRAIPTLAAATQAPAGWSDHTLGNETALAAVALGAALIEKHLTLDRSLPGPDHAASLEPDEFAALVAGIRTVERALGDGRQRPMDAELENRQIVRRSIVAAVDLPAGTTLDADSLTALRPANGIAPTERDALIGKRTKRALRRHELIAWEDVE
jgi:sialic acid synthase SpsE